MDARAIPDDKESKMSLRDQGYRFYASPNKRSAKWIHPAQKAVDAAYSGWVDVTDWPDDEFAKWLMS